MRGKVQLAVQRHVCNRITPAYAGKRRKPLRLGLLDLRITPAYAGKRDGVCGTRSNSEDHPRLCGEKLSRSFAR